MENKAGIYGGKINTDVMSSVINRREKTRAKYSLLFASQTGKKCLIFYRRHFVGIYKNQIYLNYI